MSELLHDKLGFVKFTNEVARALHKVQGSDAREALLDIVMNDAHRVINAVWRDLDRSRHDDIRERLDGDEGLPALPDGF